MANIHFTEEELLELVGKLKLDAPLNISMERCYKIGQQGEMGKHHFLEIGRQPIDDLHFMFQKIGNGPEEYTAEDLALSCKEYGNLYMKHKQFRLAIYCYTKGLEAKCDEPEVQAVLYNNRSAAQFFLKNYRSALADAQKSLEYTPDYVKARWRAAQCAFELERFDLCTQLCEKILENDANNENGQELLRKNKQRKLEKERNERKEAAEKEKQIQRFQRLCNALKERKVKFHAHQIITAELLEPKFPQLQNCSVRFDEDNETLVWPATFCYPEFNYCEFRQDLREDSIMADVVKLILDKPLSFDQIKRYRPNTVNVYYEDRKVGCVHKVNLQKTIREIAQEKGFTVFYGCLQFYLVRKNSVFEHMFIHGGDRNAPNYAI